MLQSFSFGNVRTCTKHEHHLTLHLSRLDLFPPVKHSSQLSKLRIGTPKSTSSLSTTRYHLTWAKARSMQAGQCFVAKVHGSPHPTYDPLWLYWGLEYLRAIACSRARMASSVLFGMCFRVLDRLLKISASCGSSSRPRK